MGSGAEVRYLKGYRQLEDSQNCQILRLSKLKVLGPLAKTGNWAEKAGLRVKLRNRENKEPVQICQAYEAHATL